MQDDLAKKDQEIAKITVNNEKRLKAEKQELQMMLEKAEQDVLQLKSEAEEKEQRLVKAMR